MVLMRDEVREQPKAVEKALKEGCLLSEILPGESTLLSRT